MSPDGLLWTFNIRKGVKFTSGDELTAADVKFSIERYASDASTSAWSPMHRQTVAQVEAPDTYTVKVQSKNPPYLFYPDAIAGTWIHPKKYFDQVGLDTFSKQPVGTARKLTKFTPGVSAELAVNSDYWGPSSNKPAWNSVVLFNTPEESTCIAMLKRGEADIVGVKLGQRGFAAGSGLSAASDPGVNPARVVLDRLLESTRPNFGSGCPRSHGHCRQSPGAV